MVERGEYNTFFERSQGAHRKVVAMFEGSKHCLLIYIRNQRRLRDATPITPNSLVSWLTKAGKRVAPKGQTQASLLYAR